MLTKEENERLAHVGPGTPMGNLLRRYWHPVAAKVELDQNPVKKVRILGEDLVLYRDRQGQLGLLGEACMHRRTSLTYGIPEDEGLRCPYHGWLYDSTGQCMEQPIEPEESTFYQKIKTTAYPVQEFCGLIFAYMGPEPAPLLPRWDVLVWDNCVRVIHYANLQCNWLQIMENSVDALHVVYLHGYYPRYVLKRNGKDPDQAGRFHTTSSRSRGPAKKAAFDLFEGGIILRRLWDTEDDEEWTVGHPVILPNMKRLGDGIDWRVPIDDTHTWRVQVSANRPGVPVPPQESIPMHEVPATDEKGGYLLEFADGQDNMACITQGAITDRSLENLGASDAGVAMYRRALLEQIERVERGEDPVNVWRDPEENEIVEFSTPGTGTAGRERQFVEGRERFNTEIATYVRDLYRQAEEWKAAGKPLLPRRPRVQPEVKEHREVVIYKGEVPDDAYWAPRPHVAASEGSNSAAR